MSDIPQAARERLFTEIYLPAFVKSASERGVIFRSDADVLAAIKIAQSLEILEQQQTEQPAQPDTMLKAAAVMLEEALTTQPAQQQAAAEKQASLIDSLRETLFAVEA